MSREEPMWYAKSHPACTSANLNPNRRDDLQQVTLQGHHSFRMQGENYCLV